LRIFYILRFLVLLHSSGWVTRHRTGYRDGCVPSHIAQHLRFYTPATLRTLPPTLRYYIRLRYDLFICYIPHPVVAVWLFPTLRCVVIYLVFGGSVRWLEENLRLFVAYILVTFCLLHRYVYLPITYYIPFVQLPHLYPHSTLLFVLVPSVYVGLIPSAVTGVF